MVQFDLGRYPNLHLYSIGLNRDKGRGGRDNFRPHNAAEKHLLLLTVGLSQNGSETTLLSTVGNNSLQTQDNKNGGETRRPKVQGPERTRVVEGKCQQRG